MIKQKKILIKDYIHLNRNGYPCTLCYKYRLIQNGKATFKWIKEKNNIYVLLD
jgi:hypothetical protein